MGIIDTSRIKIEIDGIEFSAKRGAKIIEIADEAGIYIPRFCYHKKLSIAANCRMCLVEVEKAPKLFPACATPVTDGMKIFTNTQKVISAQRAVMEFLLINHPLDCPICDQGGECELQDLTIGYGCSSSRFIENKRVFVDYDLGPLVSTDVTRCILCSRCVRFCSEISGTDDLGIINRGSNSRIFTFLKSHLRSGLSGNVIDLCPVGSLTAKPSKFKVRPWELIQKSFVSCHDCIGSNLYVHIARDKVIRVVPKRNEVLNETWISDRDRFSYEGMYSPDRITSPMVKSNGVWKNSSWVDAFKIIAEKFSFINSKFGGEQIAALASPNSTCEEFYLLQKMLRFFGSNNIDHRLNQIDFKNQDKMPLFTGMNIDLNELDKMDAVFVIGSDIVLEQPIIGIKLRKIVSNGGSIFVFNPVDFNFFMNVAYKKILNPIDFVYGLSCVVKSILDSNEISSKSLFSKIFDGINKYDEYNDFANKFYSFKRKVILLGSYALFSPDYSKILSLCNILAKISDSYLGVMTEGTNSAGAWINGFVPHRLPGGKKVESENDNNCFKIFSDFLKFYILFGVEIENDSFYSNNFITSLKKADFVLSFSSFKSDVLLDVSSIILPIAVAYENSGTFVNISGIWQSFECVVSPDYEVRFGWKALIDLANYMKIPGFTYFECFDVLSELKSMSESCVLSWDFFCISDLNSSIKDDLILIPCLNQYKSDALVRRAVSLQKIKEIEFKDIDYVFKCNKLTYDKINIKHSSGISDKSKRSWLIYIDESISDNSVFFKNYDSSLDFGFFSPYKFFSFDKI